MAQLAEAKKRRFLRAYLSRQAATNKHLEKPGSNCSHNLRSIAEQVQLLDKTRQDKTRQDKTRQDKTELDWIGLDWIGLHQDQIGSDQIGLEF